MDVVALQAAKADAAKRYLRAVPQLIGINGHSYAQGIGAESDASGYGERYAKTLGASRWEKRAINGAILCWAEIGGQGDGGWSHAINTIRQGANLSNVHPYFADTSVTAQDYGPRSTVEVMGWGINDLGQLGSNSLTPFLSALRSVMSFAVAAKIIKATDTNFVTPTGTFAGDAKVAGQHSYVGSLKRTTAAGDKLVYTVPSDVPSGRVHGLHFQVLPADNVVVTVSRGGTQLVQRTISGSAICDPSHTGASNPGNVYPIRLGMPGDGITIAGGDSITITLTSATAGGMGLTAVTIEADPTDGPILHLPLPNKCPDYSLWATYPFGPNAGTNPMNDASVDAMKAAILAGPAVEFGNRVVTSDFDAVLNRTVGPTGDFRSDKAHPNNRGHSRIANQMVGDLVSSGLLTPKVCVLTNGPIVPFWLPLNLHHVANAGFPSSPSFGNSWTSFVANSPFTGGNIGAAVYPGFRRDEQGRVHLRGQIASGATGTVLCTLPAGYLPANDRYFPITGLDSAGAVVNGQAKVAANGQITITFVAPSGTLTWLALDSIIFQAEV